MTAQDGQQAHNMQQMAAQASAASAGAEADRPQPSASRPAEAARESSILEPDTPSEPPPPAYSEKIDELVYEKNGLGTRAALGDDGRINITINQKSNKLSSLLAPALRSQLELQYSDQKQPEKPYVPPALATATGSGRPPALCVVIMIVGSRGDVQPFIALGQVIKKNYGHRVRIATHPVFKSFVQENGLEFFSIGGDPAELMAFMVKHPGLMPGMDAIKSGDITKRRKQIYEMIKGCWRACIEAGDGMDMETNTDDPESLRAAPTEADPQAVPFIADAIIANPPSFAHIHIAEKLGIPIHMMFTMPWSPTQAFPHPLANIQSTNAPTDLTNFLSYVLVEMLTTQGLGDLINRFREYKLGLEPMSLLTSPGILQRLKIPHTYCWSPALIPKPKDWGMNIDISGFYFLSLANNYQPPSDLAQFLAAGEPPVYIGFGSIVVDDPTAMTEMIFKAVKLSGKRALVSKGWGGIGADELGKPDDVFMLGNCPHDWLFTKVACVVHHGGAGTTAAGIAAGKPTVVIPFFGDQQFWGQMIHKAGAGPEPVPYSKLDAEKLALMITSALEPATVQKAKEMAQRIHREDGAAAGAESFQARLDVDSLRCMVSPSRAAAWHVKGSQVRLSACAASVLAERGLLDFANLRLYRAREFEVAEGPWEPISGAASALMGTITDVMMGAADFPREIFKAGKKGVSAVQEGKKPDPNARTPESMSDELRKLEPAGGPGAGTPPVDDSTLSPRSAVRSRAGSRSSAHRTRSHSPSEHSVTPPPVAEEAEPVSLESLMGAGKGVGRIVGAGLKSPMDFTMGLAKGFRNAPKLYGDDTVRPPEKVTGFKSGLVAAGKNFGLGFYDGVTGVITQPLQGAAKEGASGFVKGVYKGAFGLILKPGAAIWGLPGFAMAGVYKEIQKQFGSSVQNYLIAARTAQGHFEALQLTELEKREMASTWQLVKPAAKPRMRENVSRRVSGAHADAHAGPVAEMPVVAEAKTAEEGAALQENALVIDKEKYSFRRKLGMSFDERKKLAEERKADELRIKEARRGGPSQPAPQAASPVSSTLRPGHSGNAPQLPSQPTPVSRSAQAAPSVPALSLPASTAHDDAAFEDAIAESVRQTSRGNPQEDEMIARALRQSVNALREAQSQGLSEEEALAQATAAGMASGTAAGGSGDGTAAGGASGRTEMGGGRQGEDEDEHLERAMSESKEAHEKRVKEEEAARREEELVIEYVKKQSLREEELRLAHAQKGSR